MIAEKANKSKLYPHIFIDQTNEARVTGLQVYTDILSKHKEVVYNSMLGVWISKADFTAKFQLVDSNTAIKYADPKQTQNKSGNSIENEEKSNRAYGLVIRKFLHCSL